jgi:hypothetical protein
MLSFKKYYLKEVALSNANVDKFNKRYGTTFAPHILKNIFDRFNKVQPRLKNKDIFGYKDIKDLQSAIQVKSGKEVLRNIKQNDANVIVNNERVLVVEPLTMDASIKYGANTKWCTAATDEDDEGTTNQFTNYFHKVSLVYFIDRQTNNKFAIAHGDTSELPAMDGNVNNEKKSMFEAFDEKDNQVNYLDVLNRFGLNWERDIQPKLLSLKEKGEKYGKQGWHKHYPDGYDEHYINGKLSRTDGPAVIDRFKGVEIWYTDGKRNRLDGPAFIQKKGDNFAQSWWVNDKLHRTDGPALERNYREDSVKEWYINGVKSRNDGPAVIKYDGNKVTEEEYWRNGKLDRKDGPAKISEYTIEYYVDGKRHRLDGPAYYYYDKNNNQKNWIWFVNDTCTRLDGPASVTQYSDGRVRGAYWVDGNQCWLNNKAVETPEQFEEWKKVHNK